MSLRIKACLFSFFDSVSDCNKFCLLRILGKTDLQGRPKIFVGVIQ